MTQGPHGDGDLVRAVLGGERSAYAALYDRHARLIRAICYNATRDLADAQDLSQEVFLRAYRKLGELRDPDRFAGWLVSIARRVCCEWRRGRSRDRHRYVGLDPGASDQPEVASSDGRIGELREAILSLPERERLALQVFYLQDQSADDACAVLRLSRSGLYRVLGRARRRLERVLRAGERDMR